MAKYRVPRASSSSITFSTLFTTSTPYLSLSTNKRRYKALPKRERVKINLNFSSEDLPKANEVIAAKVPRFGTARIRSSPLTRFSSTATKKSQAISFNPITLSFNPLTPTKPSKLTSIL